jgi:hypothetical protein
VQYVRYAGHSDLNSTFLNTGIGVIQAPEPGPDKLAANYLAFIKLAAIRIWLRAYESTP